MSNIKNGEVSWTEFAGSSKKNSKDTWLRLNQGSNVIRLLTLPYQYHQHQHVVPGGRKYGYRVNCAGEGCPLCAKGEKAKRRWMVGVIDRKTSAYKILDITYTVFKDIQTYAKDEDWGDPTRYDIDIVVDKNGGSTGYYSVVAKPLKPLSANDILIKDEQVDLVELTRLTTPPTPEKVEEKLQKIAEEIENNTAQSSGDSDDTGSTSTSASNDDDEDYFKDFDKSRKAS